MTDKIPEDKIPIDSYEAFTRHLQDREFFGQKLGLEKIKSLLHRLGDPHKRFPSIHIAGTNGKGSTAAMLASILNEAGIQTGLYTSPHLVDFCERIRIGADNIDPKDVLHLAQVVRQSEEEPLSFFEFATAIAFLHFGWQNIQLGIIETGLGGRLDATNVITPMISIVTSIGFDHTKHLGESIEEISFEKAGILKPGVPMITGPLPSQAMEVIREMATVKECPLHVVSAETLPQNISVKLEGAHQRDNAGIALTAVNLLRGKGFIIEEEAVQSGLEMTVWPGRLETVSPRPWIVLDGAHNPSAMRAVAHFLEERLLGRRLHVLFGAMSDKDIKGILTELAPLVHRFIFTAPNLKRAADPHFMAEIARPFEKEILVAEKIPTALQSLTTELGTHEALLVTGSLFTVGEARQWFGVHD